MYDMVDNLHYITIFGVLMEFLIYGLNFPHRVGEFSLRTKREYYFLSSFRTDFVTERDGRLVRGRAGDTLIAMPDQIVYHGPTPEATEGFRNDWIIIKGEDFGALLERYPLPINEPFSVGASYLRSAIERIDHEKAHALAGADERCELIMREAIIEIYRAYLHPARRSRTDRLNYARNEVMRDFKRQWTLAEMAALAGYSQSRFSNLYSARYGKSPVDDLIEQRIERARLLLLYGGMSVEEVAEATGFSSIYYFSRAFKARVGASPAAYRARG